MHPRPFCYVCGLSTSSPASFTWHLAKCLEAWRNTQKQLPKSKRRKMPKRPSVPIPTAYGPFLDAWNREVREFYYDKKCFFTSHWFPLHPKAALTFILDSRPRCTKCGRAFTDADTLSLHMERCDATDGNSADGGDRVAGAVGAEVESGQGAGAPAKAKRATPLPLVLCYVCCRYTGLSSAAWHLKVMSQA